jgi:CMP-N,N'-diacetyllegionaminic acid synthase
VKILALITARGGSKRLPGKNIKPLGGLPLIAWSIRAARDSGCCADVLVSTDDHQIAKVARDYGASVPWLRPAELATDVTGSVEVALHALKMWQEQHGPADALLLLQPTSPFRAADAIGGAIRLFEEGGGSHPVVSVSPARSHPAWCFRIGDHAIEPFLGWDEVNRRSQDMEPAWTLNGSLYLISARQLRDERRFLTPTTWAFQMERPEDSIDIDTMADWEEAERVLTARRIMELPRP